MVEGGSHGGSVAAPVAGHILQQIVAMEQGTSKVELTALAPAHNPDPFKGIETLSDYEHPNTAPVAPVEEPSTIQSTSNAPVQMGADSTRPQPPKQKGHPATPPASSLPSTPDGAGAAGK